MSFLQRGLLLFAVVEGLFFVIGNGQFVVGSPYYVGDTFPVVRQSKRLQEEPITGTTYTSSFSDEGENRIHTKNIISDKRNKNWVELETDEVSKSVPNVYGYPSFAKTAEKNEVRYFNTMSLPQQPIQESSVDSDLSPLRAMLALRTLASQLGNLLLFIERAPVPLSMFMLGGALNLNQEPKPSSDKSIYPTKDDAEHKQTSDQLKTVKRTIIVEQPPIVLPFGMPPPVEPRPNPGRLSQYFTNLSGSNSESLKTSKPKPISEDAYQNGKVVEQISNEFNPAMYLPDFGNNIPRPGIPNYGRRRIDNNLRRVQDVPYTGFFPDYNAQDPYSSLLHPPGYYDYDLMKSPYGKPKDHKKAWKKEQKKLLKEKIEGGGFGEEGLTILSPKKKQSKKRRNEMKRDDMDEYMFWPPPPSYVL